ncbi:hypothetical protein HK405_001784, partial [Cladochytrium tenue]
MAKKHPRRSGEEGEEPLDGAPSSSPQPAKRQRGLAPTNEIAAAATTTSASATTGTTTNDFANGTISTADSAGHDGSDSITVKNAVPGGDARCVLMWFRSDLRTTDSRALAAAAARARDAHLPLAAVFVPSFAEWVEHNVAPVRVRFVLESLRLLRDDLAALGVPLAVLPAAPARAAVPDAVAAAAVELGAVEVFWNIEYEVNEAKRDAKARRLLEAAGIKCHAFHDQCIVEPGAVRTKDGSRVPVVFTPFRNAWLQ